MTATRGKRMRRIVARAATAVVAAFVLLPAWATQQRSFVSSIGSDLAACTLAAPCRSFGTAIAHTNDGGEVVVLDSAGYGPVTITKSISLIAPAGVYAGITVAGGDGVTVNAPGAAVVLRGLAINGQGGTFGVRLHDAARLRIENCVVSNMNQDGIHHEAAGADLVVVDTIVRDNGNFGVNLVADASIALDRVRAEHNETSGLHVGAPSGIAHAVVNNSAFRYNGGNGIIASTAAGQHVEVQVDNSILANNGGAGFVASAVPASSHVIATLSRNTVSGNGNNGILLSGTQPTGLVLGALSANVVAYNLGNGVYVHDNSTVEATANVAYSNQTNEWVCDTGSTLRSYGNNVATYHSYSTLCYVTATGDFQ